MKSNSASSTPSSSPHAAAMPRREFLRSVGATAAGLALPAVLAPELRAAPSKAPMKLGLATNGFNSLTNDEMAQLAADAKLDCVQLFFTQKDSNYWKYNKPVDVSAVTEAECHRIAKAYRSRGLEIQALGVYANLIEPDEAEREKNFQYFADMMRIAKTMNVRMLLSECGSIIVPGKGRDLSASLDERTWPRLVELTRKLIPLAEKHNVTIAIESYFQDLLGSATAVRYFMEEINHPRVRALLDPANLLPHNTLEEMFNALAPYIVAMHAKDRKLHVTQGVAAGKGDLDYRKYIALARKHCPNLPLVLEYVSPQSYQAALAHVRSFL
ncbi:MAG: sugar phosphate isomerase/epimerase [Verrucomicrobia bacterium]|nr:sugar phosphate isomerase/epimerase [Verrucomicrobiota bacterium]